MCQHLIGDAKILTNAASVTIVKQSKNALTVIVRHGEKYFNNVSLFMCLKMMRRKSHC